MLKIFERGSVAEAKPQRLNNIVAVLDNQATGHKRRFYGRNIVTNSGDQYYAEAAVGSGTVLTVHGMNLGTATTAPSKTDTNVLGIVAGGSAIIDSGYPRTADNDSDNTGAGADIVTWRSSFGTADANANSIAEVAVSNVRGTAGTALSIMRGTLTAFNKTNQDTLKMFVNHTFNGV